MKDVLSILIAIIALLIIASCTSQEPKDECNLLKGSTNIDNCYFEKAISTMNISLCEKIKMDPFRESCISEIGGAVNDLNICEGLDEAARGSCYTKIAINNQNESICSYIESDYWWDVCHYEVGIAKNSEAICYEMWDVDKANECYGKIAEAKQDEWSCTWISLTTPEYRCLTKLALMKENVSICSWIFDPVWRDGNCIKKFAEKTNNISVCGLIKIDRIKQDCLGKFES